MYVICAACDVLRINEQKGINFMWNHDAIYLNSLYLLCPNATHQDAGDNDANGCKEEEEEGFL